MYLCELAKCSQIHIEDCICLATEGQNHKPQQYTQHT